MEADGWGVWDGLVHTAVSRMDHYQGPTVQHRELCSILHSNLNKKRIWRRRDGYM